MSALASGADGLRGRQDNIIRYDSPSMNGFKAIGWMSLQDAVTDDHGWGAGLHYSNGPLFAAIDYITDDTLAQDDDAFKASAKYTFGNFAIWGNYEMDDGLLSASEIDENFGDKVNHVGLIPDDNRRELDSAINKAFSFKGGMIERIGYISSYNVYWGMDGTLRSWQIDEGLYLDLINNYFTLSLLHTMEYKINDGFIGPKLTFIPSKGGWSELYTRSFRNDRTRFASEFNAGEWQPIHSKEGVRGKRRHDTGQ